MKDLIESYALPKTSGIVEELAGIFLLNVTKATMVLIKGTEMWALCQSLRGVISS